VVTALKRKSEDTPPAVSCGAKQKKPHGDTSNLHMPKLCVGFGAILFNHIGAGV
jgi:hypothetical protein